MTKLNIQQTMDIIISALKERGYDPYTQIYGYLKENNPIYITSHNGARDLIQKLSKADINDYIRTLNK